MRKTRHAKVKSNNDLWKQFGVTNINREEKKQERHVAAWKQSKNKKRNNVYISPSTTHASLCDWLNDNFTAFSRWRDECVFKTMPHVTPKKVRESLHIFPPPSVHKSFIVANWATRNKKKRRKKKFVVQFFRRFVLSHDPSHPLFFHLHPLSLWSTNFFTLFWVLQRVNRFVEPWYPETVW